MITKLKRLADTSGVCLLLVHHTRKQQADDKFDMISGTNGLMGTADGAFLLQKEQRTDNAATLDISGRDLQDQRLYLKRDEERLAWELERRETEPYREPSDPVLEAVATLGLDIQPNALAKRLNVRAGKLLLDFDVRYENTHIHTGSRIRLAWMEDV